MQMLKIVIHKLWPWNKHKCQWMQTTGVASLDRICSNLLLISVIFVHKKFWKLLMLCMAELLIFFYNSFSARTCRSLQVWYLLGLQEISEPPCVPPSEPPCQHQCAWCLGFDHGAGGTPTELKWWTSFCSACHFRAVEFYKHFYGQTENKMKQFILTNSSTSFT